MFSVSASSPACVFLYRIERILLGSGSERLATSSHTTLIEQNLPQSFTLGSPTSAVQSSKRATALWNAMRSSSVLDSESLAISPALFVLFWKTRPIDNAED